MKHRSSLAEKALTVIVMTTTQAELRRPEVSDGVADEPPEWLRPSTKPARPEIGRPGRRARPLNRAGGPATKLRFFTNAHISSARPRRPQGRGDARDPQRHGRQGPVYTRRVHSDSLEKTVTIITETAEHPHVELPSLAEAALARVAGDNDERQNAARRNLADFTAANNVSMMGGWT